MSTTLLGRSAARRTASTLNPPTATGQASQLRQLSDTSWIITADGRLAGSIRKDHDFLVFDRDGMLIAVVATLADAELACTPGDPALSYSTRSAARLSRVPAAVAVGSGTALASIAVAIALLTHVV